MIICVAHSAILLYLPVREAMTVISGRCLIYDATVSFPTRSFLQIESTSSWRSEEVKPLRRLVSGY